MSNLPSLPPLTLQKPREIIISLNGSSDEKWSRNNPSYLTNTASMRFEASLATKESQRCDFVVGFDDQSEVPRTAPILKCVPVDKTEDVSDLQQAVNEEVARLFQVYLSQFPPPSPASENTVIPTTRTGKTSGPALENKNHVRAMALQRVIDKDSMQRYHLAAQVGMPWVDSVVEQLTASAK